MLSGYILPEIYLIFKQQIGFVGHVGYQIVYLINSDLFLSMVMTE